MAGDTFGFLTDQNTLMAVILGAVLATIGGFTATILERRLDRRDRERNAALFFGEVLSTLAIIVRFADETKKIGEPYGPVTMRMLRSARNELDIYDRNRETLFDLGDADLRARIQTLAIRLSMPLDGVIEATADLKGLRAQLRGRRDEAEREELEQQIRIGEARREAGYQLIVETAGRLREAVAQLEPVARHAFDRLDGIARS
jgi:hypothetical protein